MEIGIQAIGGMGRNSSSTGSSSDSIIFDIPIRSAKQIARIDAIAVPSNTRYKLAAACSRIDRFITGSRDRRSFISADATVMGSGRGRIPETDPPYQMRRNINTENREIPFERIYSFVTTRNPACAAISLSMKSCTVPKPGMASVFPTRFCIFDIEGSTTSAEPSLFTPAII